MSERILRRLTSRGKKKKDYSLAAPLLVELLEPLDSVTMGNLADSTVYYTPLFRHHVFFRKEIGGKEANWYDVTPIPEGVVMAALREASARLTDDFPLDVAREEGLTFQKLVDALKSVVTTDELSLYQGTEIIPRMTELVAFDWLGIGVLYALANDERISEVYLDSPDSYIYLDHSDYGRCETRIQMSQRERDALRTHLDTFKGYTMDYANPSLKNEFDIAGARLRVSLDLSPLSVSGFSMDVRRLNQSRLSLADLITRGVLPQEAAAYLVQVLNGGGNVTIIGEVASGKALDVDTKILTPVGYKRMGDVRVGDSVMGRNGFPTRVMGVYPQGKKEAFKVTFNDGNSIVCCDEHLWSVSTVNSRVRNSPLRTISTNTIRTRIAKNLKAYKHDPYLVPATQPMEFPAATLPLDPYFLGVMIGNGNLHKGTMVVTLSDPTVIQHFNTSLEGTGTELVPVNAIDYRVSKIGRKKGVANPLTIAIRKLGLNVYSEEKFIPEIYKLAHLEARIALFQGLMDTDGTPQGNKDYGGAPSVEYSTSSPRLAEDVTFLAESLGCVVRCVSRIPHFTYKGERKQGLRSYRVYIRIPASLTPFRHKNKLLGFKSRPERLALGHRIDSIEPVGGREMVCISVDAPDQLYVVDHHIATHNTSLLNALDYEMNPTFRRVYIEDAVESVDLLPAGYHQVKLKVDPFERQGGSADAERTKEEEIVKVLHRSPDVVILGEIQSDAHSRAFFHALSAGIRGLQTFHASSLEQALRRWREMHGVSESSLRDLQVLVLMERPDKTQAKRWVKDIAFIAPDSVDKGKLLPLWTRYTADGPLRLDYKYRLPFLKAQTEEAKTIG